MSAYCFVYATDAIAYQASEYTSGTEYKSLGGVELDDFEGSVVVEGGDVDDPAPVELQ